MNIRQTPEYHQGFYDAAQLEPLWDGAHPNYETGWRAFWEAKELFNKIANCPNCTGAD